MRFFFFFYFAFCPLELNNLPPKNHTLFIKMHFFKSIFKLVLAILAKFDYFIIFCLKLMKFQSWSGHFVPPPLPWQIGLRRWTDCLITYNRKILMKFFFFSNFYYIINSEYLMRRQILFGLFALCIGVIFRYLL